MRQMLLAIAVVGASSVGIATAHAQDLLLARADSLVLRGDSLGALRLLDDALRANATNAAVWHRRGVLAWSMSGAERRRGFMKRDANDSLLALADSSLLLATRYGVNSPGYLVDLGRFYLTSNSAKVRSRATKLFEQALKAARKSGDSAVLSRAADEMGMVWWRRYEDRADRHIYSAVIHNVKDRTFLKDPRSIAYFIDNQTIRAAAQDWSGQDQYLSAWEYFSEALRANPDNDRALRHSCMALADRKRWVELQHLTRERLTQNPRDGWAWLANGLAEHRLHDGRAAAAAFDSALKHLPPNEVERYDRLTRIFTPRDSSSQVRLPQAEQDNVKQMFWLMADPLWTTPDNEHRLEFLSRVVYAELRFSVDEFGLRGADTDRGEVYIRYGPPPAVISFPPDPVKQGEHRIRVLWWYSADEAFLFRQLPTYAVSTLDVDDARELRRLRDTIPVVWTNAGEDNSVDTVGVQLVRFRAPNDSADVFVAAELPIERMVRGIDLRRGTLEIDFRTFTWRAQPVYRKTLREVINFARQEPTAIRAWRARLKPGTFLYRVEALQPDAMRGARAASRIEIVGNKGFGMSDVLVADQVTPKAGVDAPRWSDFLISPNLGKVRRGQPFAVLWETYGLGAQGGNSDYRVAITLNRVRRGGLGGFAAKIIGGVASAIGLSNSGQDKVSLSFPRQAPARPAAVDYVTLDLGTAPAGQYLLSVEVTDQVSNRKVMRESAITIVE